MKNTEKQFNKKFKIVGNIYETSDYSQFKFLDDNRDLKDSNVRRKEQILKEEGRFNSPILVNQDMGILDGQHRFTASAHLKKPVQFIVTGSGNDFKDIVDLNNEQEHWSLMTHINVKARHNENYRKLQKTIEEYGRFGGVSTLASIINGGNGMYGSKINKAIKEGNFVYKNDITDFLKKLQKFVEVVGVSKGSKNILTSGFVIAMYKIQKSPNFSWNDLYNKVSAEDIEGGKFSGREYGSEGVTKRLIDVLNRRKRKPIKFVLDGKTIRVLED